MGLAADLAGEASTVVVDCNESSPGVARRLGLRLQPHVLDAVEWRRRAVTSGRRWRQPAESLPTAKLPFDVVAGLPAPSEWQRFSPATADVLLAACRSGWRFTVVTTSPIVEDLRRWVDRYGLSRHLLTTADTVVGVCEATPRGVLRFVDWLAECQPSSPVVTVVNKVAELPVRGRRGGRAAAFVVRRPDRGGGDGAVRPSGGGRRVGRHAAGQGPVHPGAAAASPTCWRRPPPHELQWRRFGRER